MSTLLLRCKGPMQSWAVQSRFSTREAGREPSKSGIVGLLAAALGRSRGDSIDDLADLTLGVRVDQPGRLLVDYHTARVPGEKHSTLSWRHYLADAAFTVAVSGEGDMIAHLSEAVHEPAYPLFLGRRSCPAPIDLHGGVIDENDVESVLRNINIAPWIAADWYRKDIGRIVHLPISRDARPNENGDLIRDVPRSFDPRNRDYGSRTVIRLDPLIVENPDGTELNDPFLGLVKDS